LKAKASDDDLVDAHQSPVLRTGTYTVPLLHEPRSECGFLGPQSLSMAEPK